jgi:hypothetical protein
MAHNIATLILMGVYRTKAVCILSGMSGREIYRRNILQGFQSSKVFPLHSSYVMSFCHGVRRLKQSHVHLTGECYIVAVMMVPFAIMSALKMDQH